MAISFFTRPSRAYLDMHSRQLRRCRQISELLSSVHSRSRNTHTSAITLAHSRSDNSKSSGLQRDSSPASPNASPPPQNQHRLIPRVERSIASRYSREPNHHLHADARRSLFLQQGPCRAHIVPGTVDERFPALSPCVSTVRSNLPGQDDPPDPVSPPAYHRETMSSAEQPSDSLLAAMTKARIPAENHQFIRKFVAALEIADFRAMELSDNPYVRASRRDGLPDLHIHYGYTNGFHSEAEIIRVAGGGSGRAPSSRKGTWYVAHPLTKVRPTSEAVRNVRREAGVCGCGLQLSLTGVCASCD